jgi:hypothetical protein
MGVTKLMGLCPTFPRPNAILLQNISPFFSQAVAALSIHILAERQCLAYSEKVAKYWPEFGQNGKADITVEDLLNHRAGLVALDEPLTLEDARNPARISAIIEAQTPNWEPGTQSGYHAITFGWLVDQLVRRVDPKRRSLAQFIREEITQKHGKLKGGRMGGDKEIEAMAIPAREISAFN